jgi:peptidase E
MNLFHLIGGGPGAMLATRRHLKRAVQSIGAKKPLIAYVGAATNDNAGFQKMLSAAFLGTGARLELVRLVSPSAEVSAAEQLLADADAVFLSGGDVELGMSVLHQRGVADRMRRLAKEGTPFIGISAGSIMAGAHWVRFPDGSDEGAQLFECLGLLPMHFDAHAEADDWEELKTLVGLLAREASHAPLGYGLTEGGCLEVRFDGGTAQLRALGAPIVRVIARDGAAVLGEPLMPARSRSAERPR